MVRRETIEMWWWWWWETIEILWWWWWRETIEMWWWWWWKEKCIKQMRRWSRRRENYNKIVKEENKSEKIKGVSKTLCAVLNKR